MKILTKFHTIITLLLVTGFSSCSKTDDTTDPITNPGGNNTGTGQAGVVGMEGPANWDKLSNSEKDKVKGWNTIFMHQSVGGDLEDGCEANGFKVEYFDLQNAPQGLSGNVFSASNGMPFDKIAEFKENILAHKNSVKIAIFKFGYADINDDNLEQVKTAYKKLIDELRSQVAGLKFVHVAPPLVYITSGDDGNSAKMKMAQWMKDTFKNTDVIFDLTSIESDNGACALGNVWRICDQYRSTADCPSKNQGIDAPEGQGHLCETAAIRISKAFLLSIYNAGK